MIVVPQITVQHDISTVLEDVRDGIVDSGGEDVWVSCYKEGQTSVHGKLHISKSIGGVVFDAREGIEWSGASAVSSSPWRMVSRIDKLKHMDHLKFSHRGRI
jgi:proteasomal ATPase-associated factor 1